MDGTASAHPTSTSNEPPLSIQVVTEVAAAVGADPLELDPLYDVVDPEALDRLFEHGSDGDTRWEGSVSFTMADCDVTIDSDGDVDVTPLTTRSAPTGPTAAAETDVSSTD